MQSSQRLSGHYASIYPSQHDANLVLVRQQRDLFSGGPSPTLGIPDVTTHVGSVIHAFETLTQLRQQKEGEKIYESSSSSNKKSESIHKIILPPPPPKISTSTHTDPAMRQARQRPKGRAPDIPTSSTNTASATTQTTKFSGDENESSALDSLNLEDEYRRSSTSGKFPQSYVKSYKVLPPFVPPRNSQPSRIPTKTINKPSARNRMSDSSLLLQKPRTDVFLTKPIKHYTEDDIENDFLRGSTVSQSFIKNVIRKSPARKISTYEQNFLINNNDNDTQPPKQPQKGKTLNANNERGKGRDLEKLGSNGKFEKSLIDEVSKRYKEYSGSDGDKNNKESSLRQSSRQQQFNFQPRSIDRAEL